MEALSDTLCVFNGDVEQFLLDELKTRENLTNEKDNEEAIQKLKTIRETLSKPPSFTSLRINLLKKTREDIMLMLQQHLNEIYILKKRKVPTVTEHPQLNDVLIVPNYGPDMDIKPLYSKVIVDLRCGLSVMRGSNIFSQGVQAAPSDMKSGDKVSVFVDIEGKCNKGLTHAFQGRTMFVGNGMARQSRYHLFVKEKENASGVAVQMSEPVYDAPALSDVMPSLIFPQNIPSIVCSHVLDPQPGETILDMCSAPGGKTSHIASLMRNMGRLVALDKAKSKIAKIKSNIDLWELTNVEVYPYDSTKCFAVAADIDGAPPYPANSFHKVLVDVPCSALGKRPSIYNKTSLRELTSYPAYQKQIFRNAVDLVKPGGTIVYSTCTITSQENEHIVQWALAEWPQLKLVQQTPYLGKHSSSWMGLGDLYQLLQVFRPDSQHQLDEINQDTIGFFIAKFIKDDIL